MGIPAKLKTDNGPGYTSKSFQCFLEKWNIQHTTSIPYKSQGQALVERANRTLKEQLNKQQKPDDNDCSTPQARLHLVLFKISEL